MMMRLTASVLLSAIVSLCQEDVDESAVLVLNSENFDAAISSNPRILVEFYAPWCGHCKNLTPEWAKAAKELEGIVPLAKVDATEEEALATKYDIKGYPKIKWFLDGVINEYGGGRKAGEIVAWVQTEISPAIIEAAVSEVDGHFKGRNISETLFLARGTDAFKQNLEPIALTYRGVHKFVFTDDAQNSLKVHRGFGEEASFSGDFESQPEALRLWVKTEMLASFGQVTEHTFQIYLDSAPKGVVWLCFDPDTLLKDPVRLAEGLIPQGLKTRGEMPYIWLDTIEYEEHAKEDLRCDRYPMIVIQLGDMTKEEGTVEIKKFKKVVDKKFTADDVQAFLADVLADKIEPIDELDELDDPEDEEDEDAAMDAGDHEDL